MNVLLTHAVSNCENLNKFGYVSWRTDTGKIAVYPADIQDSTTAVFPVCTEPCFSPGTNNEEDTDHGQFARKTRHFER
jgi:hypothetical protein